MSFHWNPTNKWIEYWLDMKSHEFTTQESKNPWLSKEELLDYYLYIEIHKCFFTPFPIELYEWITKLTYSQGRCKLEKPIVWTLELVRRLEESEDKIAHAIDHWLEWIIGGFIIEIVVDTLVSYSEAKWCFLKGLQGKYVKSLNTWICYCVKSGLCK